MDQQPTTRTRRVMAWLILAIFIVLAGTAIKIYVFDSGTQPNPARTSDIEDVPIPESAQIPKISTKDAEALARFRSLLKNPSQVQSRAYNVPDRTFSHLEQWYDARMPDGRAWVGRSGTWLWCDGKHWHNDAPYFWKDYHIPSKHLTLTIHGTDGTPPFIIVAKTTNAICERD